MFGSTTGGGHRGHPGRPFSTRIRAEGARRDRGRRGESIRGGSAMATFERPKSTENVPLDLLPVMRNSGIFGEKQLAEIKSKMLQGDYPLDSVALAECLVRDQVLTGVPGQEIPLQPVARPDRRPLHHPRPDRLGLDGPGLQGPPSDDGPRGRAQDHRAGDRLERSRRGAVPARDEAGRPARSSQRRPGVRRRPVPAGALHRDGVRARLQPG